MKWMDRYIDGRIVWTIRWLWIRSRFRSELAGKRWSVASIVPILPSYRDGQITKHFSPWKTHFTMPPRNQRLFNEERERQQGKARINASTWKWARSLSHNYYNIHCVWNTRVHPSLIHRARRRQRRLFIDNHVFLWWKDSQRWVPSVLVDFIIILVSIIQQPDSNSHSNIQPTETNRNESSPAKQTEAAIVHNQSINQIIFWSNYHHVSRLPPQQSASGCC